MPIGIAANSRPSARPPPGGSPNVRSAISGNTTRGMPNAHRHDVDEERHEQHLVQRGVAEPVDDLAQARPRPRRSAPRAASRAAARSPTAWPAARRRRAGRASGRPTTGISTPGQQRARDRAGLHDGHVQRVRRGQLLGGQQPRDHRAAGGLVDRQQRRLHREQHEHHPDVADARSPRSPTAPATSPRCPAPVTQEQRAAVDGVRDRAAPQPEHHERDQPEEPGQADVGRRAGELRRSAWAPRRP